MNLPAGDLSARFRPSLRFRKGYAWAVVILLATEVLIALFVADGFVRPYLGDALAVVLVYCAFNAALDVRPFVAASFAFAVAVVIEFSQYFRVLRIAGLEGNAIARTVLGSGFDSLDLVAYAAGAIGVLIIEATRAQARA